MSGVPVPDSQSLCPGRLQWIYFTCTDTQGNLQKQEGTADQLVESWDRLPPPPHRLIGPLAQGRWARSCAW